MTTFVSLFSGIGGFDLAFERAGMTCLAQVEIDKAARNVLARHFPTATRFEDVTHVGRHNLPACDVLCGGFPCQDLSIAGNRAGLAGERSGLYFEFQRIIMELRPRYVVIENVPGLLSSNDGKDFAVVLAGLTGVLCDVPDGGWKNAGIARGRADLYRIAWRVLDAQYFGVAQRRRRVFLVASLGDGSCASILFERESGARDSESSGEARGRTAPTLSASTSSSRNRGSSPTAGHFISGTLAASGAGTMRPAGQKNELSFLIPTSEVAAEALDVRNLRSNGSISGTLQSKATGGYSLNYQNPVITSSSTSNKRFFDEETQSWCVIDSDGIKRFIDPSFAPTGALAERQRAFGDYSDDEIASAIKARDHKDATDLVVNAFNITFGDASGRRKDRPNGGLYVNETDKANTLDTNPSGEKTVIAFDYKASAARQQPVRQHKQSGTLSTTRQEGALIGQSVRRLTPVECERLQGFPDGWTDTPQPDSPRYKQLGNAVAVPVAEWIGQRIMAGLQ